VIDLKSTIVSTLEADTTLKSLISDRVYFLSVPEEPTFPCITYREENNTPALAPFGSPEPAAWTVFVIDIWSKGDTTTIAAAVDAVMRSLGLIRVFGGDLFEQDTKVFHKSMRFAGWQVAGGD
jgi:hypothetical protein